MLIPLKGDMEAVSVLPGVHGSTHLNPSRQLGRRTVFSLKELLVVVTDAVAASVMVRLAM